jgi:hypothetical protein
METTERTKAQTYDALGRAASRALNPAIRPRTDEQIRQGADHVVIFAGDAPVRMKIASRATAEALRNRALRQAAAWQVLLDRDAIL